MASNTSASVQAAFELFDDDSSDEEQAPSRVQDASAPLNAHTDASSSDASESMRHLVEQLQLAHDHQSDAKSSALNGTKASSESTLLFEPWKDVQPVFVGPITLVHDCGDDIGGGRGFMAKHDLQPGTKVLVEKALMPWPKHAHKYDPSLFIAAMKTILARADANTIVSYLSYLHPQKLTDVPDSLLQEAHTQYGSGLRALQQAHPEMEMEYDSLLQNVLAMQTSAFDSGIFLHNAMFNHECNPNCIKFSPEGSASGASEVWVVRPIRKGEALTLSYLYPREQSRRRRQHYLSTQFGFECICPLCCRGDSVLTRPVTEGLEDLSDEDAMSKMEEVEDSVATAEQLLERGASGADVLSLALETLSDALEIAAHDHVVFMRIHKLVSDCCDVILRARPTTDVREYAILFLRSSYELLELQRQYLHPDHIDLARTLNDVSQGIQLLLSIDPAALLNEFSEWKNFRETSKMENSYRQEYRRIKQLYE